MSEMTDIDVTVKLWPAIVGALDTLVKFGVMGQNREEVATYLVTRGIQDIASTPGFRGLFDKAS